MYSWIEGEWLLFIRQSLCSLPQEMEEPGDEINALQLPTSFMGSRKWTAEQTADALALAWAFGGPSLFLTATCNPDWPEIKSCLRPGQSAADIPVIVIRAFKMRLQYLMKLQQIKFGKLVYIIKIVEFQKRGLPHAHLVIKVS